MLGGPFRTIFRRRVPEKIDRGLGHHDFHDGFAVTGAGDTSRFAIRAQTLWLPYVGVRPTLSYRLPAGPVRLVLSLTPFARWDLVKKDVSVATSSLDPTVYEVGGTTFGLVGGVGIEL